MLVDGDPTHREKELVYDAKKDIAHEVNGAYQQSIQPAAENHRRAGDLERSAHERTGLPGVGHQPDAVGAVVVSGHRGYAQSPGSAKERSSASCQPTV